MEGFFWKPRYLMVPIIMPLKASMVESHAVCEPLVSLFPLPLLSTPAYFCVDMEGLCHWLVDPPSLYTPNNIEIYLSLISIFGRALSAAGTLQQKYSTRKITSYKLENVSCYLVSIHLLIRHFLIFCYRNYQNFIYPLKVDQINLNVLF